MLRALAVCLVGAALFLWQPLFGGSSTLGFDHRDPRLDLRPWVVASMDTGAALNPILPDPGLFVLPGLMRLHQLAERGAGPWWDGSMLLGFPLAANLPAPVFHPLLWLTWWLEPITAMDVLLWLHTAAAAFLAFRAARLLGAAAPAAALAAVGCSVSDWMVVHWGSPPMAATAAWFPGLLCAWAHLRQGRRWAGWLEAAMFGGLSLVSGFPQLGVLMCAGFGVLALTDGELRARRGVLPAATALLVALSLAMPQFVVSGGAYAESLRSQPATTADTHLRGLPVAALIQVVLPRFFGQPRDFATSDPPAATMEAGLPLRRFIMDPLQNSVVELSFSPGILVLLLLPMAFRRRAPSAARRLAALGLLAVAGALLWPLLASALPGLDVLAVGNMKRVLVLAVMGWPVAAALLLDDQRSPGLAWPLATGGLLLAILVVIPIWAGRLDEPDAARFASDLSGQVAGRVIVLLLSLLALMLAWRGGRLGAWLPALALGGELVLACFAFHSLPAQHTSPFAESASIQAVRAAGGRYAVLGGMNLMLPMPAGTQGLSAVHGALPMVPRRTAELLGCIEGPLVDLREPRVLSPFSNPDSVDHALLDLLGVRTVVFGDTDLLGLGEERGWPLLFVLPEEGLAAWSRPSAGPRAFLCTGVELVPEGAQRLARLRDPDFPVHATLLLERPPRQSLPAVGSMQPLLVESEADDAFGITVSTAVGGIAVLTEAWDPGWSATLDGRPAQVLIVDHALMGVEVEVGRHEIVLRYAPPGWKRAVVVSLGALGLWLLVGGGALWARRGQRSLALQRRAAGGA